jgi:hypothetical protein
MTTADNVIASASPSLAMEIALVDAAHKSALPRRNSRIQVRSLTAWPACIFATRLWGYRPVLIRALATVA